MGELSDSVMAGLVPAIHDFLEVIQASKTWMPGTRPGMTYFADMARGEVTAP
jgi:hypothetical protein